MQDLTRALKATSAKRSSKAIAHDLAATVRNVGEDELVSLVEALTDLYSFRTASGIPDAEVINALSDQMADQTKLDHAGCI